MGLRVRYLHSNIDTIQRIEILRDLRLGEFDVLVGINLLREGLDLPEVSLVAILDADKEGFLRSETSLIQTMGRAARNVDGQVVMYADTVTDSMQRAITRPSAGAACSWRTTPSTASTRRPSARPSPTSCRCIRPDDETAPVPGKDRRSWRKPATRQRSELRRAAPDELGRLIRTLEEEMHEAAGRPALRVRGPFARRDQRPQTRAARRSGLRPP